MKAAGLRAVCFIAVLIAAAIDGGAQQRAASSTDPRVGLKAGLHDICRYRSGDKACSRRM